MTGQQNSDVLAWLRNWKSITAREAMLQLGCMRLAARIHDLREAGHVINREMIEVTNRDGRRTRVARYRLVEEVREAA